MNRNYGFGAGILLLIGGMIGAFLALMFGTDENGETKESVRGGVKKTKDGMREFKEKQVDPFIEVMEEKSREAKLRFDQAVDELEIQLIALKGSLQNLDQEKYGEIVDDVVKKLKKSGNYTNEQLNRLSVYFKEDYDEIAAEARAAQAAEKKKKK